MAGAYHAAVALGHTIEGCHWHPHTKGMGIINCRNPRGGDNIRKRLLRVPERKCLRMVESYPGTV